MYNYEAVSLCFVFELKMPSPAQARPQTSLPVPVWSMPLSALITPAYFLTNCTENKSLLVDFAEILHGRKDDVIT